jgi:phage terminase small subunit
MPKVTTRKGATKGAKKPGPESRKKDSAKPKKKVAAKAAKQPAEAKSETLSALEAQFCEEYLKDLNGTQAYLRCKPNVTPDSARALAAKLFAKVSVQERVAELQKARSERTLSDADRVLSAWNHIAEADPTALMEYRRGCCRYCWGENFRFQRTPREMEIYRTEFDRAVEKRLDREECPKEEIHGRRAELQEAWDPEGGIGYNRNKPANPECPECFGDGVGFEIFKDTRYLPEHSKRLFAGIKATKNGLEIKTQNQAHAREMIAKHNAMFSRTPDPEEGKGGPIQVAVTLGLSAESQDALQRMHERRKPRATAS